MIKKIVFSVLVFLIVLEVLLRISGLYKTGAEKQGLSYEKKYGIKTQSWLHTWSPNTVVDYKNNEFKYKNIYNNLGNRELNSDSFSSNHKKAKVVCLGDSFTEGDGAPSDSTWIKSVEKQLNKEGAAFSFYNAGVCGSDVFFDYKMLTLKLNTLKPEVVVSTINYSDVYDVIFRGGNERFISDSTTKYKDGPFWEPAYQYSHVFRVMVVEILGYSDILLIKKSSIENEERKAISLIKNKIAETKLFCDSNGITYYLIIHPHPLEVNKQNSKLSLAFLDETYAIDLFSDFSLYFKNQDIKQYSWKQNHHYNSKGYWLMGNFVTKHLSKLYPFNKTLKAPQTN